MKENKMEMKWDYYALLPPSNQGGLIKLPPYGGSLKYKTLHLNSGQLFCRLKHFSQERCAVASFETEVMVASP